MDKRSRIEAALQKVAVIQKDFTAAIKPIKPLDVNKINKPVEPIKALDPMKTPGLGTFKK